MTAKIKTFSKDYYDRITQLINKTNQFNLTTKRYTQAEVEDAVADEKKITFYGSLDDKFGSNGIVSLLIAKISDELECHIDTFLMSCRVLKRGMEQAMLDALVSECKKRGLNKVIGTYIPTKKNKMVEQLYKDLGFSFVSKTDQDETKWLLSLEQYANQNKFIKVNE